MKNFLAGITVLLLLLLFPLSAAAETFYGDDSWNVTFDGNKLISSFRTADIDDVVRQVEPGDAAIIHIQVKNASRKAAHWYMTNEILRSMEDSSSGAQGGSYGYALTYTGPSGITRAFFDSDAIGGEILSAEGEGLHQVPSVLEDFFFVGKLDPGQSGTITVGVHLDGETQGNTYQNAFAKLEMRFAVEENLSADTIPKTGDGSGILFWLPVPMFTALSILLLQIPHFQKRGGKK